MRPYGQFSTIRMALAAASLLALTAGCSSIRDHRGFIVDNTLLQTVQPGVDNRLSVERTLGRPTFTSQFGDPSWYYVSINTAQPAFGNPRTTEQTLLRVDFDAAGNVAAIERGDASKVVRLNPNGDKTPTLGRERSFLEDLFGNIGTVGAPGVGGGSGGPGPTGG